MALRISSGCTFLAGPVPRRDRARFSVVAQTLDNGDVVKGPTESFDIPDQPASARGFGRRTPYDQQACQLWALVRIPAGATVTLARIRIAADNEDTLFFDGREMGPRRDWPPSVANTNLTMLMTPGRHVLAVMAFNSEPPPE